MNLNVNNLFLFEIIFFEISFSKNIVCNNKNANCFVDIVVLHDINLTCFANSSIIVIIMSYVTFVVVFFDFESFMMKFSAIF